MEIHDFFFYYFFSGIVYCAPFIFHWGWPPPILPHFGTSNILLTDWISRSISSRNNNNMETNNKNQPENWKKGKIWNVQLRVSIAIFLLGQRRRIFWCSCTHSRHTFLYYTLATYNIERESVRMAVGGTYSGRTVLAVSQLIREISLTTRMGKKKMLEICVTHFSYFQEKEKKKVTPKDLRGLWIFSDPIAPLLTEGKKRKYDNNNNNHNNKVRKGEREKEIYGEGLSHLCARFR